MPGNYPTTYKKARKMTLLTQEEAAEALGLSVESLKAYEQGGRMPPNAAVERMALLYGTPWLKLAHVLETSRDLGVLPAEIEPRDLSSSVLILYNRDAQLAESYRRLLLIAEDDEVDELEQPDFQQITAHILDVIAAGFQVLYATGPDIKKDHPKAGTFERSGARLAPQTGQKHYTKTHTKAQAPICPGEEVASP